MILDRYTYLSPQMQYSSKTSYVHLRSKELQREAKGPREHNSLVQVAVPMGAIERSECHKQFLLASRGE